LIGLPAGSYYAAAVAQLPDDGDDAWQDPAYLESLIGRATTFGLGEGQSSLNLDATNKLVIGSRKPHVHWTRACVANI
jgi:hypothetical protein